MVTISSQVSKGYSVTQAGVCKQVEHEFGNPVDPILMQLDADTAESGPSVARVIAEQAVATHAMQGETPIRATWRAMGALGCATCVIQPRCSVYAEFLGAVAPMSEQSCGESATTLAVQIASAPTWLKAGYYQHIARVLSGSSLPSFDTPDGKAQLALSIVRGEIDPITITRGVTVEPVGLFAKQFIPAIAHNPQYKGGDQTYERMQITNLHGDVFHVVDVSPGLSSKSAQPTVAEDQESRVLCSKLLDMIAETDKNGLPQLFNVEGTKIKPILGINVGNGFGCFEIRMVGKNRMYILVKRGDRDNGTPHEIILMGRHSGDEKTQANFIAKVLNGSRAPLVVDLRDALT